MCNYATYRAFKYASFEFIDIPWLLKWFIGLFTSEYIPKSYGTYTYKSREVTC